MTHEHPDGQRAAEDPAEFWERRYKERDQIWSGRVNATLAELLSDWEPGRSLDLGCGEGGDVLWLAERGWEATGIDLSPTAAARAGEEAARRGLTRTRFVAGDIGAWIADPETLGAAGPYELITASYLQSPVALPRERAIRAAAERLSPGGALVLLSHAAPPPWAQGHRGHFIQPGDELAALAPDPLRLAVETAEVREREAVGPNGETGLLADTLVVLRRR